MTIINMSASETILGGFGPIESGIIQATYWAGTSAFQTVVGDEVRFPSTIEVKIAHGRPSRVLDLTPTRGVCCVRWWVRAHTTGAYLSRYTEIPDVPEVDFGDLIDVDPATFEPSEEGRAAWEAAVAQVQALVDKAQADVEGAVADAVGVQVPVAVAAAVPDAVAEAAPSIVAPIINQGIADADLPSLAADAVTDQNIPGQAGAAIATQTPDAVSAEVGLRVPPAVDAAITASDIPGAVAVALAAQAGKIIQGVGMPNGVVTAGIGTIYVDTASTNGASVWRKATGSGNTGWTVAVGDTGWRNVISLVDGTVWNNTTATLNYARIRRTTHEVHQSIRLARVKASGSRSSHADSVVLNLPQGFTSDAHYGAKGTGAIQIGANVNFAFPSSIGTGTIGVTPNAASGTWAAGDTAFLSGSFLAATDWPTSLPGTAA